jgi:hypothetical protein
MANIQHKCPICKCDFSSTPNCGLRLFGSSNECPCCLESKNDMMALPCGHQICLEDLKRLNMDVAPSIPVVPVVPVVVRVTQRRRRNQRVRTVRLQRRRRRMERSIQIMRQNNSGRRCGWCGLQGHTVSKCRKHRFQCGCSDDKSRRHKHILSTKRMCRVCKHKGHRAEGCFKVVKYR